MSDTTRTGDRNGPAANGRDHPALVVIGASAGGIRALQAFFEAMPTDTGAAFVVVVHLDPEHRSELPQILGARTRMPVIQIQRRHKLEADHVYVIPPDRRLQLVDHEIAAEEFDEPRGRRAPIDLLFRSVAERLGDGFAVILSGAGSDGALGVRAVKESGGIILVQEPNEAEYGSMPRSAVATGAADLVLPVRELAAHLADLIRLKQANSLGDDLLVDEDLLRRILAHVRTRTGHDFAKYKRSTVLRRIARRMQVTRTDGLKGYYDVLRENNEEAPALLSDLLISVTTFFRDGEIFEALQRTVIPQLFSKDRADSIRVWVAGCATGEEAYSLGMLLLEEASRHEMRPPIQVFGSDLDARALIRAREGRYPLAIEADVKEERLRRFFAREGDFYRVRQELRDIVLFASHDLLKDPPFSHVSLVSCRNVLIYLDRELQEQVVGTFHYALNPAGFLVLGASEHADNPPGLFRLVDRDARIYSSTAVVGEKPRLLPSLLGPVRLRVQHVAQAPALSPTSALSEATMHRRALEKLAPPSILVDESQRVLHMSDTAGRYLQPSGGPLSSEVADLVRPELRFELRSALHRLFEQGLPTLSLPLLVRFNGKRHRVHLHVKASDDSEARPRSAVVMFIEGDAVEDDFAVGDIEASGELVHRLTQELELTQARLRTVREESDGSTEELRAANEELQSINEEYRSTSEELETSKEELQSINEELQTVNSELKLKLETISRAHSDLQNLMAATDFGTLFLDSALRIKRYTEHVTELFRITPADEGRPITDFAHLLDYQELTRDARAVLTDLTPVRREVRGSNERWYDVRMRPYRTVDDRIDGVVITFVDITERREVEEALRTGTWQLRQQRRLVEMSREPIYIWDFDGGIVDWNRGCEELYGFSQQEALGKRKEHLLGTTVPGSSLQEKRAQLVAEGHWDGELRQRAKDGRTLIIEAHLDLEVVDGRRLVLESARDVTQRRALQQRQQLLLGELTHRVKNTLAVVQAIAHQTQVTSASPAEFVERFSGRLVALANSHGLLVQSDWQGADLAALTRVQLQPYASDAARRLHVEGPAVSLSAELATPFGLVLHELATNAAKYGALSLPSGEVGVSWELSGRDGHRVLRLLWRETGSAKPESPTAGLGSQLIEHAIPGATVRRQYHEDGLACTIELPLPTERDDAKLS